VSTISQKLRKYFSGKLVLVQSSAGVGAFALRSVAAYATADHGAVVIVATSLVGSFLGYVSIYSIGYWVTFKRDYATSGRRMGWDVIRLQLVEQSPNIPTLIPAALTQIALIEAGDVDPVVSVNVGSWFGPHKIVNFIAMVGSNSLKKGWVDGTWAPGETLRKLGGRIAGPFRSARLPGRR